MKTTSKLKFWNIIFFVAVTFAGLFTGMILGSLKNEFMWNIKGILTTFGFGFGFLNMISMMFISDYFSKMLTKRLRKQ